mmetsp:Transcript_24178/g.51024  ORF Transcript_24178/g.51024 Transcript_24178/m.51024 type:complete len:218 (+) Transcript_24178:109-762(+)
MKSSVSPKEIMVLALFITSTFAPSADAFISSPKPSLPIAISFEPTKPTSQPIAGVKEATIQKKMKYDLGIGKNQPVVVNRNINNESSSSSSSLVDNQLDPTQFLIEHESVRSYLSPLDLVDPKSQTSSCRKQKESKDNKRKNLPKVQHRRHSKDVLHIQDPSCTANTKDNDTYYRHPIIFPINNMSMESSEIAVKLDPNTVWVEMMLHYEHSKIISN